MRVLETGYEGYLWLFSHAEKALPTIAETLQTGRLVTMAKTPARATTAPMSRSTTTGARASDPIIRPR